MAKIDWRLIWREFNKWADEAELRYAFNDPMQYWKAQQRKIRELVEKQL